MAVFYSFHYQQDCWRVQQIIKMGIIEGNQINSQNWESIKRQGDNAIKQWIDEQMKYKSAVIVLNGYHTSTRPWVQYEIRKAWENRIPLLSININGLKDRNENTDFEGGDPFENLGEFEALFIPRHKPSGNSREIYAQIHDNLEMWSKTGYVKSASTQIRL